MRKRKKKKKNKNQLYVYMIISVTFITFLMVYGFYLISNRNDTKSLLINKSYNIVYTVYEDKTYEKKVPAVNIKGLANDINKNISNFVEPYLNEQANKIYYHYQINGNILSLFITIDDFELEGPADVNYLSYIINLKELKILSNEEIYSLFGFNEEYLLGVLDNKFKNYYEEMKKKKLFDSNESYEEFLKIHEITNFKDQIYCDIYDGKLKIYLDYSEWADNEIDNYFDSIGHLFEVE